MGKRGSDELLQIDLGEGASLDVIKLDDCILFVISERGGVQKRYVAKVSKRDGIEIAKFIVGIQSDEAGDSDG